ncbi:MAG: RHS repeat-associated core domain-containing protein [Bdellovibrionota bacterium]
MTIDANGNIIYKSNKQNGISYAFEYSALNQLKKVTVTSTPLNGNILKVLEYKYDPAGRRILRQVTDNVDSSKSKTQKYYFDAENIIAEIDAENNLTASYTHSPLGADDVLGAKFTSSAVSNGLAASAGNVYYLKDHLNTVNEITNASGEIVQKMEYSAYGVLKSVKDSTGNEVDFAAAPVRSSFTYTGREFEPELNMYYYRARYYDPNTGRFLQQDPDPGKLASPNTFLSKYIYAGNNPAMLSDPSGMSLFGDIFEGIGNVVGSILNAGSQVIASVGAVFDQLIKNKGIQTLLTAVLAVVVVVFLGIATPVVAIAAAIAGLAGAVLSGDVTPESFLRNFAFSLAVGLTLPAIGFSSPLIGNSIIGSGIAYGIRSAAISILLRLPGN